MLVVQYRMFAQEAYKIAHGWHILIAFLRSTPRTSSVYKLYALLLQLAANRCTQACLQV